MSSENLVITPKRPKGDDGYKVFSIRIKEELVARMDDIATRTGRSRNEPPMQKNLEESRIYKNKYKSVNFLIFKLKTNKIDAFCGTLNWIRTSGLPLRSDFNTLIISGSKTWKALDIAGFHRCYIACQSWLFSANFYRFLWVQLANNYQSH